MKRLYVGDDICISIRHKRGDATLTRRADVLLRGAATARCCWLASAPSTRSTRHSSRAGCFTICLCLACCAFLRRTRRKTRKRPLRDISAPPAYPLAARLACSLRAARSLSMNRRLCRHTAVYPAYAPQRGGPRGWATSFIPCRTLHSVLSSLQHRFSLPTRGAGRTKERLGGQYRFNDLVIVALRACGVRPERKEERRAGRRVFAVPALATSAYRRAARTLPR